MFFKDFFENSTKVGVHSERASQVEVTSSSTRRDEIIIYSACVPQEMQQVMASLRLFALPLFTVETSPLNSRSRHSRS